jgi:hypothetical protein
MREDRDLLAQRELDDGLILAAPEQSEDAPKDRDRESRYGLSVSIIHPCAQAASRQV